MFYSVKLSLSVMFCFPVYVLFYLLSVCCLPAGVFTELFCATGFHRQTSPLHIFPLFNVLVVSQRDSIVHSTHANGPAISKHF
uniref:Putative secreted protein n=1 Tax=Anopheles darlingi TaxID=43151 RepID=A0A2M4D8H8_ANODA